MLDTVLVLKMFVKFNTFGNSLPKFNFNFTALPF